MNYHRTNNLVFIHDDVSFLIELIFLVEECVLAVAVILVGAVVPVPGVLPQRQVAHKVELKLYGTGLIADLGVLLIVHLPQEVPTGPDHTLHTLFELVTCVHTCGTIITVESRPTILTCT